ncbi:MAG: two-component system, OmpR family, sensor kinase, partial [Streptosporangiaceae bacterium]|jgi:two-component system OmpR family sensor kinase|nr:two-component system, OmpR family, sensor kinase [Streptosporangiaceae bacterium]
MTASGRLSLRARLLVLLICVTAAFLLIMGAVTAVVLNKRLASQFNADLVATATRKPQALAGNSNGYLAAAISVRTRQVVLFTPGTRGTEFQQAVSQLTAAQIRRDYQHQPFAMVLADGTRLRAVGRLARAATLDVAGLSAGRALIVVARPVGTVAGTGRGVVVTELITGGVLILLLAAGGRWLIGRGLAPLGQMASAARQITTQGNLAARMPDADDSTEVGRLGGAINTMLDRIQQAFGARLRSEQKVRQFAADASHELRTPLTTIRGYAELYRQGALGPDQLPDAMRRIEQEAQRMSTLVAELLELARLDRTSSLDLAETDLAGLVRDAVADARAVEPGRPVRAEAPDRLVAAVDEARIRQVLANLLGNIREHTPKGTPVAVRLGQMRDGVVLEVADAGPGMSQQDAAQAFDRFHRGAVQPATDGADGADGGGPDGPGEDHSGGGGSGLGLSIVQAIAVAHGGQATLESWPGHGTRVRIWLPTPVADPRHSMEPSHDHE